MQNLAQLLSARAVEHPGLRVGTVDDQRALDDAVSVAAGGAERLRRAGLASDDRLGVVGSNSTEYLIVWMACLLAGIPVALINPTYPQALLAQMIDRLDPALVFTDLADRGFARGRRIEHIGAADEWDAAASEDVAGQLADRHDIASFMHTSGTTGVPKFCAQSHEYFRRLGAAMSGALELRPGDRVFAPLPLFHINPLGYGIVGALNAGGDALTARRFSAHEFWPQVRESNVTVLVLHAPPVEILKRSTSSEDADGHRVRTMFYADREFMRRFRIGTAISGYGSTEAAGVSHLRAWHLDDKIPDNSSRYGGRPRTDVEDRLDGSGQILVREREPGTLFSGYLSDRGLDHGRDQAGWFATGDLGRREANGELVFLERAAESIRVKGEFVPIPFVEKRLGEIQQLKDYALWKMPGELVDDEVVLYVVADPVPIELIQSALADVPMFMRPKHLAQVSRIPRDAAAGKVQRRRLPEQGVLQWITMT